MISKELLKSIAAMQSEGNDIFAKGIFPSFRSNTVLSVKRADDNIFFTALICYTLKSIRSKVSAEEQTLIDRILNNASTSYPLYKNAKGEITYNFWRTNPSRHFPNGILFGRFNYFRLPDDIDDTSVVYLAKGSSPEEVMRVQSKMKQHSNLMARKAYHIFPEYRNMKLYSSWFGKNMPIEIDVCAITNALLLFSEYNIPLNEYDEDCIAFIDEVMRKRLYKTKAFRVSPNYANSAIILYHVTRLVQNSSHERLKSLSGFLTEEIQSLLKRNCPLTERIILETSLMRLGVKSTSFQHSYERSAPQFYWFRAGMMSTWENPVSHALAPWKIFHFVFVSDAYFLTLLYEHQILSKAFTQ